MLTNKEFSKTEEFIARCVNAGVAATVRQASKFRMGRGKAFKTPLPQKPQEDA